MALYELAILGAPTDAQVNALKQRLDVAAAQFRLRIGEDISLAIQPAEFKPNKKVAAAAVFFGGTAVVGCDIANVLDRQSMPILPVASTASAISSEIPPTLRTLNCIFSDKVSLDLIFSTLLECIGLLPRQRRVALHLRRHGTAEHQVGLAVVRRGAEHQRRSVASLLMAGLWVKMQPYDIAGLGHVTTHHQNDSLPTAGP